MNYAQTVWMEENPNFTTIGPPRPAKFKEWGTLSAAGEYERLDDKPRKPIQVGTGNVGVCIIQDEGRNDG